MIFFFMMTLISIYIVKARIKTDQEPIQIKIFVISKVGETDILRSTLERNTRWYRPLVMIQTVYICTELELNCAFWSLGNKLVFLPTLTSFCWQCGGLVQFQVSHSVSVTETLTCRARIGLSSSLSVPLLS